MKYIILALLAINLISCTNSDSPTLTYPKENPKSKIIDIDRDGTKATTETLPNGLKVLAISNPNFKESMVSINVNVGQIDDPIEHKGMAHFVEHMLFQGNEKYPDEHQALKNLVKKYSAQQNAFTSGNHTMYYLKLPNDGFDAAVDKMANLVDRPLFEEGPVQKEKTAIHNEYQLRFDSFATLRASDYIYNEYEAPYVFGVGNKDSLANTTAADAKLFFEKYYNANNMSVTLVSAKPLNEIVANAATNFSNLRSGKQHTRSNKPLKPNPERLNKILYYNQSTKNPSIKITFMLEGVSNTSTPALTTIGSILGDEGTGSLTASLQDAGYTPQDLGSLSAGASSKSITFNIMLTEKGEKEYKIVAQNVASYLNLFFKNTPIPISSVQQVTRLSQLNEDKNSYIEYTVDKINATNEKFYLSGLSLDDTNNDALDTSTTLKEIHTFQSNFRVTSTSTFLVRKTDTKPNTSLMDSVTFSNQNDRRAYQEVNGKLYYFDEFYTTIALVEDFSLLNANNTISTSEFAYPTLNPYLPEKLIRFGEGETNGNSLITTSNNIQVIYKAINYPETRNVTDIYLLSSFQDEMTIKDVAAMRFFGYYLSDLNNPNMYPMVVAQNTTSIKYDYNSGVFKIGIGSYPGVLEKVTQDLMSWTNPERNEFVFESRKRRLVNIVYDMIANDLDFNLYEESRINQIDGYNSQQQLVKEFENLTIDDMFATVDKYFANMNAKVVLTGHFKPTTPQAINDIVLKQFPQLDNSTSFNSTVAYSALSMEEKKYGTFYRFIEQEPENLTSFVYNYSTGDPRKDALLGDILKRWIEGAFYSVLRSQKQLAYSLGVYVSHTNDAGYGLSANLRSGTASTEVVVSEIDDFFNNWVENQLPLKTQSDLDEQIQIITEQRKAYNLKNKHYNLIEEFVWGRQIYGDYSDIKFDIKEVKHWIRQTLTDDIKRQIYVIEPKKEQYIWHDIM